VYPDDGPCTFVDVDHGSAAVVTNLASWRPARRPGPTRIGYARVRRDQADLREAIHELGQLGVDSAHIYVDRGTPARARDRAQLQQAVAPARPGGTLAVASLTRLARSHHDLATITDMIRQNEITLKIAGRSLEQISAADMIVMAAQFDADLITEAVLEDAEYQVRMPDPRGPSPTL